MEIEPVSQRGHAKLLPPRPTNHDDDIEVIEVEVDDQAKTTALSALSDVAAAKALRTETERAPSPKIAAGKVAPAKKGSAPPAPPSASKADRTQEVELGDVLEVMQKMPATKAAVPASVNSTSEIRPGDVLEEIVIEDPPAPAPSASDLAKTQVRPPLAATARPRAPLAQFSIDDEVAPFASDTVDIPLDRVAGLPIWLQIKGKPGLAVVGGAVGACALIGALAIGMHFHNANREALSTERANQTSHAAASINAAMRHEEPAAAIPPPPPEANVPSVSIDDLKKDSHGAGASAPMHAWAPAPTQHTHAPARHTGHHDASAAPSPHASAAKPQGFGLIRTWIAARGEPISVDGKSVGVAPSPVRVACGEHTVAIGKEIVHANVPCDGAVTVGSPDHK